MEQRIRKTRPGNSADRVYGALRQAIISRAIAPGATLPEGEVAARFGVSRTVVRAALTRLIENGLAVRPANYGTRVASPTLADLTDIMEIRSNVEGIVMMRLAGELRPKDVERLRAHVLQEEAARDRDMTESLRLSGEFHMRLAEATASPMLLRYVTGLVSRSSLALAANGNPRSDACSVAEHHAVLDALGKGDGSAACGCMNHHLRKVTERALAARSPAMCFADIPVAPL